MTDVMKGPSRAGYWLTGLCLLLVAVGVGLIVWGVANIVDDIDDFRTIPGTPDGQVVTLSDTGEYTVFIEGQGIDSESDIPAVVLTVEGPDGNTQRIIPDRGADGDFTYTISDNSGGRLGTFDVDQAGEYRIRLDSGTGGDSSNFPSYRLRIGQIRFGSMIAAFVSGIAMAAFFTLAAIVLFIVTIVRRSNHRRRLASAYGYPAVAPPSTAWSPPTGGGWVPPPTAPPVGPSPPPPPPSSSPPPPPPPAPSSTAWSATNPPGWWTPPSETATPPPAPGEPPPAPGPAEASAPSDAPTTPLADAPAGGEAEPSKGRWPAPEPWPAPRPWTADEAIPETGEGDESDASPGDAGASDDGGSSDGREGDR